MKILENLLLPFSNNNEKILIWLAVNSFVILKLKKFTPIFKKSLVQVINFAVTFIWLKCLVYGFIDVICKSNKSMEKKSVKIKALWIQLWSYFQIFG